MRWMRSRLPQIRFRLTTAFVLAGAVIGAVSVLAAVDDEDGGQAHAGAVDLQTQETLGVFRQARTSADDQPGDPAADLRAVGDAQPGEDPTQSRRVDLPTGTVYVWPMTGGVCASFGNCIPVSYLRKEGVALTTQSHVRDAGAYDYVRVFGIARDGVSEVRFVLDSGKEVAIPVRSNVFSADFGSDWPHEMRWDDDTGNHRESTGVSSPAEMLQALPEDR
jgi:hypothetical protein